VTISDRDRRIVLILVPIVVLIAYWFLILSPKRDDLKTARDSQHSAEAARDQAVAQAAQLEKARQTFAADYAAVVRLGKAIPDTIDSPSLLVQLDRASKGTHIDFNSVTFGERAAATAPVATTTTQGPAQPNGNAAAGGAPAASAPGTAAESAGNAVNQGNQASSNVNAASGGTTTTSTTTTTATTTGAAPSTTSAALDSVALTFNFSGSYFDLADFFHRIKRFVYVANNQTFVRGRLLSIDTLSFQPNAAGTGGTTSGDLTATIGATVYLSPKAQGTTGGATAAGPAGTTTETTTTPAGSQTSKVPLATAGVR
jgi:Type II secretion system (T2SS), protein M